MFAQILKGETLDGIRHGGAGPSLIARAARNDGVGLNTVVDRSGRVLVAGGDAGRQIEGDERYGVTYFMDDKTVLVCPHVHVSREDDKIYLDAAGLQAAAALPFTGFAKVMQAFSDCIDHGTGEPLRRMAASLRASGEEPEAAQVLDALGRSDMASDAAYWRSTARRARIGEVLGAALVQVTAEKAVGRFADRLATAERKRAFEHDDAPERPSLH